MNDVGRISDSKHVGLHIIFTPFMLFTRNALSIKYECGVNNYFSIVSEKIQKNYVMACKVFN